MKNIEHISASSSGSNLYEKLVHVRRVAKVVKGGRQFGFSALTVVGDRNGSVGYGLCTAREVPIAIQKSLDQARKNMCEVRLNGNTLHRDITVSAGAAKIYMKPTLEGTGIKASTPIRAVCEAVGVKNVSTKCIGTCNPINVVRATIKGLTSIQDPQYIAKKRGKSVKELMGRVDINKLDKRGGYQQGKLIYKYFDRGVMDALVSPPEPSTTDAKQVVLEKIAPSPQSKPATRSRQIVVTGYSPSGELIAVFKPYSQYSIRFRVAAPSSDINLAQGKIDITEVPETGLDARWVVTSCNVEFLGISPVGTIVKRGNTWLAEFDLAIPGQGDSATVTLNVLTSKVSGQLMLTLLVADEEYRRLTVNLGFGAYVEADILSAIPSHLCARTSNDWTSPPEHIRVLVSGQAARISKASDAKHPEWDIWIGNKTNLSSDIQNVRKALDKFRIAAESHLNNLDIADMNRRLCNVQWRPYDWKNLPHEADAAHDQALNTLASGAELHSLAVKGYNLFNTCFPRDKSKLRGIIENLEPGSRLDFSWTSLGAIEWVAHVPWALMYLDPLKATDPVNCERFLGLRYRIGNKSWDPNSPSRALGNPGQVNSLHLLYWGRPNDEIGRQSLWQRSEFGKWERQHFVPDMSHNNLKEQVVEALEMPQPDPVGILYFYCYCTVKDGSEPVLQFGETPGVHDIVEVNNMYQGRIDAGPLVFANACMTVMADPQATSDLEKRFFDRDIRAFLGTEEKVPDKLASYFAWLFFQFFLRKIDSSPMAAGEALAQTRLFLWTQYRNPGGLFYCLTNTYDLFLASDEEVTDLQRR